MMTSALLASALLSPIQPNIVLVLVDDMGWQDTSLKLGVDRKHVGQHLSTPNLEALAKKGLTVNQAYSSCTVCTPSRTALLTGMSPAKTGITNWVSNGGDSDPNHPSTLSLKWTSKGLQPGMFRTLPERLHENGYLTAIIGKAHYGAIGTPGADPKNLGFDISIAAGGLGHPNSYYGTENFASRKPNPGIPPAPNDVPGLEKYHGKDIFLEEALALEADGVIKQSASEKKPLFLLFAPYSVHTPISPNKRLLAKYLSKGLDAKEAAYATMVETVDNALGSLVRSLESQKLLANTIVIFTSDNGGLSASSRGGPKNLHNLPLRSGKGSAYEGGVRVPFVIAGPGVPAGKTLGKTSLVSADLCPTILDFAKVPYSGLEGQSLATSFESGTESPNRTLFWHYPHYRGLNGPGLEPYSAVREGDFKLIFFYLDQRWEMYNLEADPGETMNLIPIMNEARREKYDALSAKLLAWLGQSGANFPVSRADGRPISPSGHLLPVQL